MAKVYLSSTFSDLEDYRASAIKQLRRMRLDVVAMEDYNAGSRPPVNKCLEDVRICDLYVGLFAWRYGYVPEKDNPRDRAITEMEFREAVATGKEIIVLLLDKDAPWPPGMMDQHTGDGGAGARIKALRAELGTDYTTSFFTTPDDLAARLSPAVQEALNRAFPVTPEQLENIDSLAPQDLQNLAARFEIETPYDLSDAELRRQLELKAEEYRAYKAELEDLRASGTNLDNIAAAALEALENFRIEEAEDLLENAREIVREQLRAPLERNARLMELEAQAALLRGKVEQAYRLLSAAADSFAAIDLLAPARKRLSYEDLLYAHGLRYGSTGMALSESMIRDALGKISREATPELWAHAQNSLAIALQNQGIRTEGQDGADLLADAVAAYRRALEVRTKGGHPVDWAGTQNNLGTALQEQGIRTEGQAGADLLAEAVTAYRRALEVYTKGAHPVDWAMTQNNLGTALQDQGIRTEERDGADLLAEAVAAYRRALEVCTRDAHPVRWAMTQENIALTEEARAEHDSTADPRAHLVAAREAVEAALTVFDPVHLSYNHAKATRVRDGITAKLEALPPG